MRRWFAFLLGFLALGVLSVLLTQLYIETEVHHLGFLAHLFGFLAVAMFIWSAVQFALLYRTPVAASQRRLPNGMLIPDYWRRRPRTLMEWLIPPGMALLPSGTYNESGWEEHEDWPGTV